MGKTTAAYNVGQGRGNWSLHTVHRSLTHEERQLHILALGKRIHGIRGNSVAQRIPPPRILVPPSGVTSPLI